MFTAERAEKPSKPMHMVVSRAVEVVEQIDPASLAGMTLLWFVSSIGPSSGDPKEGLSVLDGLVGRLCDGYFPDGVGWLHRLDLLSCIHYRPPGLHSMKKWQQFAFEMRPGYVSVGVSPGEEEEIRSRLNEVLPGLASMLVEHPFLPGQFRINTARSDDLLKALEPMLGTIQRSRAIPGLIRDAQGMPLPPQALPEKFGDSEVLRAVLAAAKVDVISNEAAARMGEYVDSSLPNLRKLRPWWDGLPGLVEITPLGTAIAYSNAKRYDDLIGLGSLPEMLGVS
jgi:hypothetical protein